MMPQAGSRLSDLYPNLICIDHEVVLLTPANSVRCQVSVNCQYELQRPDLTVPLRGGSSLTQIQTYLDRDGNEIFATYQGQNQPAQISPFEVRRHFQREKVYTGFMFDPDAKVAEWINKVNNATWHGGAPRTWLITDIQYVPTRRASAQIMNYHFTYTFEGNPQTWLYPVNYLNAEGKVPDDAVLGQGKEKLIVWHEEANFSSLFP